MFSFVLLGFFGLTRFLSWGFDGFFGIFLELVVEVPVAGLDFVDALFATAAGHLGELGVVIVGSRFGLLSFTTLDGEDDADDFFAEITLETVEEFLRFGAVLYERIALTDGTPVSFFDKVNIVY